MNRYGPSGSGRAGTRSVGCSPDKPMLLISSAHEKQTRSLRLIAVCFGWRENRALLHELAPAFGIDICFARGGIFHCQVGPVVKADFKLWRECFNCPRGPSLARVAPAARGRLGSDSDSESVAPGPHRGTLPVALRVRQAACGARRESRGL